MVIPKDPIPPPGGSPPPGSPIPSDSTKSSSKKTDNPEAQYGQITAKPMTFLGMHFTGPEAAKLWDAIMQQVSSQIQSEQARALKALKKLKKDSTDK